MDTQQKFIDMLGNFDNAMLVTQSDVYGIDARPMAVAEVDPDGGLWFVSDKDSGKMADLAAHPKVAVTMQGDSKFLSLSGHAEVKDDRKRIEQLWQESWRVWFPEGKSDPSITLLHIVPEHGEYWDNSGFKGLKYMFKAGKAYLQGERPDQTSDINASVTL